MENKINTRVISGFNLSSYSISVGDKKQAFLVIISTMGSTGMDGKHSIYIVDVSWDSSGVAISKIVGDDVTLTASISNGVVTLTTSSSYFRYLIIPIGEV